VKKIIEQPKQNKNTDNELKKENDKLKEIIEKLKIEHNNVKKNLENEIKKLKENIEKIKADNIKIKTELEEKLKNLNEKIKLLENELIDKNNELKKYILDNNKMNENMIIASKLGQKIISVNFMTMGNQDIVNYSMPCKKTDLFVKLEEKLYNDYPNYKNYNTYFEVNTRRIKRFKSIEENNIKGNDIIYLFVIDE